MSSGQRFPIDSGSNSGSGVTCADFNLMYGEQVAREFSLIESVLRRVAVAWNIDLTESDLDTFCRNRNAKLNVHAQQQSDEHFEQVRLLNMLYEGCLAFLKDAAAAFEGGNLKAAHDKVERAKKIVIHLASTLDNSKQSREIADELLRLYDFAVRQLDEACSEKSAPKTLAVHRIIEKIYLGYLEVEIQEDVEEMFETRRAEVPSNDGDTTARGGTSR